MLEQDQSHLDHRSNESVMSVMIELPVPAILENGVQSINMYADMVTTNRKAGPDEGNMQEQSTTIPELANNNYGSKEQL